MRDGSVRDIWESIRPKPRYTKVTYPERRSRRKMNLSVGRGHYSSSCRKNSWMFLCWDAVRTSFPGRAARPMESTTKSALVCATAYQYDWKTMRRGNRVDEPMADTTTVRRRSSKKQPTWMPRARRLRSKLPVRYRGKNLSTWYEGLIQNISQSGVLFHGPQQLPANALVELIFEMPEEISGQKNSSVLCQGRLIRTKDAVDKTEDSNELAASILDYKFLHQD